MKCPKAKLVVLAVLILEFGVVSFAQASTNKLKAGKWDDITLTSVTKAGNLTLQPGHYILQHKMGRGTHAMHFVSFVPSSGAGKFHTYYGTSRSEVGAAECRFQALNARVEKTQVYLVDEGGTQRITRIEIKGENVAHLF